MGRNRSIICDQFRNKFIWGHLIACAYMLNAVMVDKCWPITLLGIHHDCQSCARVHYTLGRWKSLNCSAFSARDKQLPHGILWKVVILLKLEFLFLVAVLGCPTLSAPPDGWVRHEGDTASFGCDNTDQTWSLHCNFTDWVGETANCTQCKCRRPKTSLNLQIKTW